MLYTSRMTDDRSVAGCKGDKVHYEEVYFLPLNTANDLCEFRLFFREKIICGEYSQFRI